MLSGYICRSEVWYIRDFISRNKAEHQVGFDTLVIIWIVVAIVVFPIAIKQKAPYGRHTRSGWGPMIDNRMAWIIMELPALIVLPLWLLTSEGDITKPVWIMVALFMLHYTNRVLIFPLRIRTKGKKMPLSIAAMAFAFNLINGSVLGYYFAHGAAYADSWLWDPRFLTGLVLFLLGAYINQRSDHLLIHLRKPGETGYKIPRGFLFDYISCPNHFGEIVEWIGFAVMTWALPGVSFAIWTAANLVPRTLNHHQWYKERFSDYPSERKAVVPHML